MLNRRLVSDQFKDIQLFALEGKARGLELRRDADDENDKDFFADNEEWIYALYKVLQRADELGWFEGLQKDGEETESIEYIK